MKRAYIKTYGCQMNEQDSSQMQSLLKGQGYETAFDPFEADMILINTCSIREKAVHKIYSELGRIRPLKEDKPNLIVGIAGCVAEQEKQKLSQRFPFLDLVFGPDHIRHLPQMLSDVEKNRHEDMTAKTLVNTGFDLRKDFEFVNVLPEAAEHPVKAFVNIQKGCDNVCSFCIVPFVRGREVSRPHQEIIDEVKALVERGVKEVTLLGQNVNSYGLKSTGGVTFAKLLELIAKETSVPRLRFTTSHPKDVGDDLIEQYRDNPSLVPHFHLPVQSGNNRVLKLMKRQYTREHYMDIVHKLYKTVPDIRFATDLIVGFPGETEEEFEDTMSLVREVGYDSSFSFVYSPRPYTKAANLEDDVPYDQKLERLQRLQELTRVQAKEANSKEVGLVREVLVEECDPENEWTYKGRTPTNKIVHFSEGEFQLGDLANVEITKANAFCLYGN
jgi:tRNA-2-methylthio-N6-dimethylallyladenosine synthase